MLLVFSDHSLDALLVKLAILVNILVAQLSNQVPPGFCGHSAFFCELPSLSAVEKWFQPPWEQADGQKLCKTLWGWFLNLYLLNADL